MPPETDNLRLQELFDEDQHDREKVYESGFTYKELRLRDAMRRDLIGQMMARAEISTANDLYRAGVVFMHGETSKDYVTAHRLAVMAAVMGHRPARWLSAATLDRLLMSVGLAQSYGTQFELSPEENKYQLRLPIEDSGLLGFEKGFFNVPSIMERLKQLNGRLGAGDGGSNA